MSVCMRPPHHIAIVVVLALAMLGTTAGQATRHALHDLLGDVLDGLADTG